MGRKADDGAGLAQVLSLLGDFEHAAMFAISRLLDDNFSYAELAHDVGCSKQALIQRHHRWLAHQPNRAAVELDCTRAGLLRRHRRWLEQSLGVAV